ncbi:MAG: hypothetical protein H0T66_18525 [Geodermatophilaceae bacterium]|nr:hypothetical protein [Geodermatophilaceae bacterium]MDQ3455746.1 hypothetical protein [Actinomycetota bacterium]
MRTARVGLSTVTLDITDALDLSELLDAVDGWLAASHTDHNRPDPSATRRLRRQLIDFSHLLIFGEGDLTGPDEQDRRSAR